MTLRQAQGDKSAREGDKSAREGDKSAREGDKSAREGDSSAREGDRVLLRVTRNRSRIALSWLVMVSLSNHGRMLFG
jgi:hypothetical protein